MAAAAARRCLVSLVTANSAVASGSSYNIIVAMSVQPPARATALIGCAVSLGAPLATAGVSGSASEFRHARLDLGCPNPVRQQLPWRRPVRLILAREQATSKDPGGESSMFEFIEIWYNRQRRHSSLGYRSPVQYEEEILQPR